MVTIHPIQPIQKDSTPPLWRHVLRANKETKTFKQDETHVCFVAKYDGGRFSVFSAGFNGGKYEVIESEQELHDSFTEME